MKNGFSLFELVIVMVIIGILTSIAIPSYRHYLVNARRSDGQAALLDLANRLENYYSAHQSYASATIATNAATDVLANNFSAGQNYILSIHAQSDNSYTIYATPTKAQATEDVQCQTFTLNNLGEKSIATGPAGDPSGNAQQCWS